MTSEQRRRLGELEDERERLVDAVVCAEDEDEDALVFAEDELAMWDEQNGEELKRLRRAVRDDG